MFGTRTNWPGLQPGDSVSFRMLVTEHRGFGSTKIRKLAAPATNGIPTGSPLRLVREVEPLSVGDPLPDYHLTNQFGQPISTAQFKGDALAITFLFTRLPVPELLSAHGKSFCRGPTETFEPCRTPRPIGNC